MITGDNGAAQRSAVAVNLRFYESLWSTSRVVLPQRFNTWEILGPLVETRSKRLEIGPGKHPRLGLSGTYFADISAAALMALSDCGGLPTRAEASTLPFPDNSFDLICAFDVIEHVSTDQAVFSEISRVSRDSAIVLLSVPLHPERWNAFDTLVGHVRRYRPGEIQELLAQHSLGLERAACFGMQPSSTWLTDLAVWWLTRRPKEAARWYNRVILPLGLRLQRPLKWSEDLETLASMDEAILFCRRLRRSRPA